MKIKNVLILYFIGNRCIRVILSLFCLGKMCGVLGKFYVLLLRICLFVSLIFRGFLVFIKSFLSNFDCIFRIVLVF